MFRVSRVKMSNKEDRQFNFRKMCDSRCQNQMIFKSLPLYWSAHYTYSISLIVWGGWLAPLRTRPLFLIRNGNGKWDLLLIHCLLKLTTLLGIQPSISCEWSVCICSSLKTNYLLLFKLEMPISYNQTFETNSSLHSWITILEGWFRVPTKKFLVRYSLVKKFKSEMKR